MTLASDHKKLLDLVQEYVDQYETLTGDKPKKVAAGRARKKLMEIKKLAHSLRGSISEYKDKM